MKGYEKRSYLLFLWLFIFCLEVQISGQPNPLKGLVGPCDNSKISSGGWGGHNIICEDGRVFETPDSGSTWQEKVVNSNLVARMIAMQRTGTGFSQNGSIVGNNGIVYSTSDNGRNWFQASSGTTSNLNNLVYAWCPITHQSWGFAVGDNSTVLVTKDGGKTWIKQTTPYQYDHFYGVYFYNGEIGWIVGSMGIIYKTINSGTTWAYVEGDQSNPTYKGVAFTSPDSGNVVGSDGFIGRTTNGGSTWIKQNSGTTETLNDIAFADTDSDTGAVVGNRGTLLNTTNGGNSWTKQDLGTTSNLNDVTYDPNGYIWIAGDNGALFTNNPRFTPPSAPGGLTASAKSSSRIDLSWLDNSNNESGFIIERRDGPNELWEDSDTTAGNVVSHQDTELTPNKEYSYRVSSFNAGGESSYSNIVKATTFPAAPASPSNLTGVVKSSTQIDLSWLDNSNNESGFIIGRKDGPNEPWLDSDTTAGNVVSHQDTGLTPNKEYSYRVSSFNSGGESSYSNIFNATTFDVIPSKPTNLTATPKSSSQIDLSWLDNSNNESGFIIEKKDGPNDQWDPGDSVDANVTGYQSTGLTPAQETLYRVLAYNSAGKSQPSNEASAKTFDTTPAAPTELKATTFNSSQIDLSWLDKATNETGYKVERKTGQNPFAEIVTLNSNSTTHSDKNLDDGLNYMYRVASFNIVGKSAYSNEGSAITALNSPTDLTVKKNTSGGAQLDWKDNSKSESGFTVEKRVGAGTFSKVTEISSNTTTFSDAQVSVGQQLSYRVLAFNSIIVSGYSNTADIVITSVNSEFEIPTEYSLKQNYPNPFNPETIISYELPEAGYVTLKVFDILGNELITLVNNYKSAGKHYSILTTTDSKFTSGCYIYKFTAGSFTSVRKMLLIK